MVDDALEPRRPPRSWRQDAVVEALGEDLAVAVCCQAPKTTGHEPEENASSSTREVRYAAFIAAMDPIGGGPTQGTGREPSLASCRDHDRVAHMRDARDVQSSRDQ